MIGDLLFFLRRYFDDYLKRDLGGATGEPAGDKVVFLDGERIHSADFRLGAVTLLLLNVGEERLLRDPEPFLRRISTGNDKSTQQVYSVKPDIRLTLLLLFVARFKQYDSAWRHLSKILEHLRSVPTLEKAPADGGEGSAEGPQQVAKGGDGLVLPAGVERLTFELITLDLEQLGQLWNALRSTHHPSLLYRVNLVAFRDPPAAALKRIEKVDIAEPAPMSNSEELANAQNLIRPAGATTASRGEPPAIASAQP